MFESSLPIISLVGCYRRGWCGWRMFLRISFHR